MLERSEMTARLTVLYLVTLLAFPIGLWSRRLFVPLLSFVLDPLDAPLTGGALWTLFGLFCSTGLMVPVGVWRLHRARKAHITTAVGAGALAVCSIMVTALANFLVTLIPFRVAFYAAFVLGATIVVPGATLVLMPRDRASPGTFVPSEVLRLRSLWAAVVLSGLCLASAVGYKAAPSFKAQVNAFRTTLHGANETDWVLTDFLGTGFEQTMQVSEQPNGAYWVLERTGRLLELRPGATPSVVLDFAGAIDFDPFSEDGTLGFARHPTRPDELYVYYSTRTRGINQNVLARFDLSRVRSGPEILIRQDHRTSNHHGGTLVFGPDGFLYFGIGDESGMGDDALGNSQRIDRGLYSGIFRIDVDQRGGDLSRPILNQPQTGETQGYFIPRDNPFLDQPNVLEEFWALGLRNPFRFSIDEKTGDIWVGDVGQDRYEEVNVVRRGSNHQWSYREGPLPALSTRLQGEKPEPLIGVETEPIFSYAHTALDRCIIGGFVYRSELHGALSDRYVYADNYSGHIRALRTDVDGMDPETLAVTSYQGAAGISSLSTDSAGRILVTVLGNPSKSDGRVMELVPRGSAPSVAPEHPRTPDETYVQLCARCHGVDGAGADVGSVGARDFTDPSWQRSVSDEQIMQVIRDGGAAVGMSPVMPAWGETFSEDEIRHLVELIRGMGARTSR